MDEIKYIRSVIEKDAVLDFSGKIDRSRDAEGQKTAILQHEMASIQREIQKIDQVCNEYDKISSQPTELMLRSRTLKEIVEGIMTRPFKTTIDVNAEDLPRELTELRNMINRCRAIGPLIKTKSNIIYELHKDEQSTRKRVLDDFNSMANKEIEFWQTSVKTTQDKATRHHKICYYCADVMTAKSINENCKVNTTKKMRKNWMPFTKSAPCQEYNGNSRHFFAEALGQIHDNPTAMNN